MSKSVPRIRTAVAAAAIAILPILQAAAQEDGGANTESGASEGAPLEERGYALGDIVLGSDDAPVTVIEYYSPTCPHCGSFHVNTYPRLKSEYIDTGKVRFIAREVYFDQVGLLAGRIARCGGPEPYYALVDVILGSQSQWGRDSDPVDALVQTILKTGFPTARLRECLLDREYGIHLVNTAKALAEDDKIQSTPTFLVGDETVNGAVPFETIAEIIEGELP